MNFSTLRRDYPQWIYKRFAAEVTQGDLKIIFEFLLGEQVFHPELLIEQVPAGTEAWLKTAEARAYLFHLGLIELISYWKATCSPEIVIEAGYLSPAQIKWWQRLWLHGLGEFWYQNGIDPSQPDLVNFTIKPGATGVEPANNSSTGAHGQIGPRPEQAKLLIPVGGGKDSAAVLGWLAEQKRAFGVLLLLPNSPAGAAVTAMSQAKETITLRRTLDPQLKELNSQGFLNGHTPFSAYLGWASVLAARIFGYGEVAVANEQSANEGNVAYHGLSVNHQYSKTTDYEAAFRQYLRTFFRQQWAETPSYFSIWRPLHELQIAQLFSKYAQFFPWFKSCNVNQQKNSWCHKCAKCVFVYTMLAPFLEPKVLQRQIFERDLFADESLLPLWLQLLGFEAHKPFECVGTQQEVLVALATVIAQYAGREQPLPVVLTKLQQEPRLKAALLAAPTLKDMLLDFAAPHFLPADLELALRQSLNFPSAQVARIQAWRQHPAVQEFAGKRLAIVGMGREGWSTYRWLRQIFPQQILTLIDQKPIAALTGDPLAIVESGPDYLAATANQDFLFMTPGIRTDQATIQAAIAAGAQLKSQTELFFELCPGKIIGVTGTKGKSTTASLIHHVLHQNGVPTVLVGNIGLPVLDKLAQITSETVVVAELSSHQLQHLTRSPHFAVIQNITSEHLDYYPDTAAYVSAKTAIARFQTPADVAIFQCSFETAAKVASLGHGQPLTYRVDPGPAAPSDVAWVEAGQFWVKLPGTGKSDGSSSPVGVMPITDIPLLGHHNLYNVAPAILIGTQLKLPPAAVAMAIRSFQSLPHRLQKVATVAGVEYYDDSLSSTPQATVVALASFAERPVVLLAGGYERHQDFQELAESILTRKVKGLVLFPPTGARLWEAIEAVFAAAGKSQHLPAHVLVADMPAAVTAARDLTEPGDVVLLSPASASFGLFKDYQDRGDQFAENVSRTIG